MSEAPAAKDVTLATDAAGLPQLAAARDWLRTAAAGGAAEVDVPDVVEYIRPGRSWGPHRAGSPAGARPGPSAAGLAGGLALQAAQ